MNKNMILNIATGVVSLGIIYMLIFEKSKDNKFFWAVLAVFFLLLLVRGLKMRRGNR